jgi:chorismate mutase
VILKALNRESVPEFKPTRPRLAHYPRTAFFKRARVAEELQRMREAAVANGLDPESVDSIYVKGEAAILEHEKRNGYDKEYGPGGVLEWKTGDKFDNIVPVSRQVVV